MNILLRLMINSLAVFAASYLLPGVHIRNFTTAIWVAVVLAVLNLFIKPIFILLTIPITIVTFGLFLLVINALMVLLCSKLVDGFSVDGIIYAVLFSLIVSVVGGIMEALTR
ncbi:MAG: phage holin family protein [Bacteroidetes bacterium]|nr:phage holin family protein [Bacteroidota bacterium]MBS1739280.1 phage holin family protein [Bacteroidota bacterium]